MKKDEKMWNISEDGIDEVGDSRSNIISGEVADLIELIFGNIVNNLLALLGVTTNTTVIIVFSRQGKQDSFSIIMTSIAFWDFIKCLCGVVYNMRTFISLFSPAFSQTWKYIHTPTIYFQVLAGHITYPMAAYVAFERALCVSFPFSFKSIANPKIAKCSMIVISVGTIAVLMPVFFIFVIKYRVDPRFNESVDFLTYSDFFKYQGSRYMPVYQQFRLVQVIICFITIAVTTVVIITKLKQQSKSLHPNNGHTSKKNQTRDRKTSKMLLWVVFIFHVNLVPRISNLIASTIEPEYFPYKRYHNLYKMFIMIAFTFDFAFSSANFFIFVNLSSSFQETFYKLPVVAAVRRQINANGHH